MAPLAVREGTGVLGDPVEGDGAGAATVVRAGPGVAVDVGVVVAAAERLGEGARHHRWAPGWAPRGARG